MDTASFSDRRKSGPERRSDISSSVFICVHLWLKFFFIESLRLSRSVNDKSMASFFQNGGASTRPARPPHDSPGQRPGFDAIIAIKRCKRATILLLTPASQRRIATMHPGQSSIPVSKPACRGLPETDANMDAPRKPLASSSSATIFH